MTLAIRAMTRLFRLANRWNKHNRQVITFSVSRDHQLIKTYGHCMVIDGKDANISAILSTSFPQLL
ncbi:hypothetical protein LZ30DRAFT_794635 [Colletotrichum cereale]|nr:hypothetical protein LZ30DRAFT_794635 [Colletotrichum cereale]